MARFPSRTLSPLFFLGSLAKKQISRKKGTLMSKGLLGNLDGYCPKPGSVSTAPTEEQRPPRGPPQQDLNRQNCKAKALTLLGAL